MRIIILRHGEEPDIKKYKDIESSLGLSNQGAVRALTMPELVNKLLNNEQYEFYTYTHLKNKEPTCRAFYTGQLLNNPKLKCDKSSDIKQLVADVVKSKFENIVICWEHSVIPDIINELIGIKPDYDKEAEKISSKLDTVFIETEKTIIKKLQLERIKYCAEDFTKENLNSRNDFIELKDDIEYSLIWDIDLEKKTYKVYPGYLIDKKKNHFLVKKYI
jgi:hypothetical protein